MNGASLRMTLGASFALAAALAACGGDTTAGQADPSLFGEGKFVTAAEVMTAYNNNADILFVDARPDLDYESGHIPEAASVPYFDVESHLDALPRDRWIVTYCECPHAEAEQVADALMDNGFTLVKVIDEGLQGWRDVGGEVVGGPPPAEG